MSGRGWKIVSAGRAWWRTHEIGIRMPLGATPSTILRSTLRVGMTPVLIGIIAGLGISAALARIIANLLFAVRPLDPWTYTGTALVFLIIAALACWIPARRAARLNPIEALRTQQAVSAIAYRIARATDPVETPT